MDIIDITNSVILVAFLVVHEFLFRYLECFRDRWSLAEWGNNGYPPLAPQNFNNGWFEDIRYYVLLIFLLLYSFVHNNDLLTLLIINVYFTANTVSHLIGRWFTIIRYISRLEIDGRGANIINAANEKMSWKNLQLLGVKKWIDNKFDNLNAEIRIGIKKSKKDKSEGIRHINRVDIKFLQQEFIISPKQTFYTNLIFLSHIFAVIVINSLLLYNMSKSGLVEMKSIEYGIDALYSVLQIISTVGFGDISNSKGVYQTLGYFYLQCFFVIMFIQVLLTVILGVAYKNSALTVANELFDNLSLRFNEKIQDHKHLCIDAILTGVPSGYLKKDIEDDYHDLGRPAYFLMINALKDYIKTINQPSLKKVMTFKEAVRCFLLGW